MTDHPASANYPRTSQYHGIETTVYTAPDGREIPHLRRRLLPNPAGFTTISVHEVREGDRIDVLAGRYLGDPEQWWRIADANPVADPRELVATPGRRLRVTLPEGVPGTPG